MTRTESIRLNINLSTYELLVIMNKNGSAGEESKWNPESINGLIDYLRSNDIEGDFHSRDMNMATHIYDSLSQFMADCGFESERDLSRFEGSYRVLESGRVLTVLY